MLNGAGVLGGRAVHLKNVAVQFLSGAFERGGVAATLRRVSVCLGGSGVSSSRRCRWDWRGSGLAVGGVGTHDAILNLDAFDVVWLSGDLETAVIPFDA